MASTRSIEGAAVRGLGTSAIVTAALALPLAFAPAAGASSGAPSDDRLSAGEILKPNESVTSDNGQYKLVQQSQGNLVLYRSGGQAMWSSPASGSAAYATMQREGNLVIYSAANKPLWSTPTAGNPGAYLTVANDGNLVIYSADNRPLWSRHAYFGSLPSGHTLKAGQWVQSKNGQYQLFMQKQGNLVLYTKDHKARWTTPTANAPGAKATMQQEGNLVIYTSSGKAAWTSPTAGHPGAYLAVQNDGSLVIYSKDGKPLWTQR